MRLILLGPPGSGKGTQSHLLCQRLHLEHIATGDMIRAAMRDHTPWGEHARTIVESGGLVPDEVVNNLVAELFDRTSRPERFVMDGYPRTLAQARAFDQLLARHNLPLVAVLLLDIADDEIVHRVSGRWSCPQPSCKATYHTDYNPPSVPGVCDRCGTALVQRSDDIPETVRNRLAVYHHDTEQMIPYYRDRGLLREVSGHGEIEQVYNNIMRALRP
jgi:adenylate kinase